MRLAVAEVAVPARPRPGWRVADDAIRSRYVGHAGGQAFRTVLHTNPLTMFGRAAFLMFALSALLTAWFLLGYQSGGMHLPALLAAVMTFVLAAVLFISGANRRRNQHEPSAPGGAPIPHASARARIWNAQEFPVETVAEIKTLARGTVETVGVGAR